MFTVPIYFTVYVKSGSSDFPIYIRSLINMEQVNTCNNMYRIPAIPWAAPK